MDRTLTKILLARTKTEYHQTTTSPVAAAVQFGRWNPADVSTSIDLDDNDPSPGVTALSLTSSPRRITNRNAAEAILWSCASYDDILKKNCVDGAYYRYIPHNRMYIQCKTAARVRLADKRRKYGLGRQTARRTTSKAASVRQTNSKQDNTPQRHGQLPPLKHQEPASIKGELHQKSRDRDVTTKEVVKRRDGNVTGGGSAGAVDSKTREKQRRHRVTDDLSCEEYYSDEKDSDRYDRYDNHDRYDDNDDDDDTYIHNDHKTYRRHRGDKQDRDGVKYTSSDDGYSKPPRDLRRSRGDHHDDQSSASSVSVSANQLLKTSSYKFVPPGGAVSRGERHTSDQRQNGQLWFQTERTSSIAYTTDDSAVYNRHRKEYVQGRRRESRYSDTDSDTEYRKFNTKDRRKSRSASPDSNSSRSSEVGVSTDNADSRSEVSRQNSEVKTTEWPIHHTETCLRPDCKTGCSVHHHHVTGNRSSKNDWSKSVIVENFRHKTDVTSGMEQNDDSSHELDLIGRSIVGQGNRTKSVKIR